MKFRNFDFWSVTLKWWFLIEIFYKNLQFLFFYDYYGSNININGCKNSLDYFEKGIAIWKNWFRRIIFYENRPNYDSISISWLILFVSHLHSPDAKKNIRLI